MTHCGHLAIGVWCGERIRGSKARAVRLRGL